MSNTDDELDDLFLHDRRALPPPSPSQESVDPTPAPAPKRKRRATARKGTRTSDDERVVVEGSSSDLEIITASSAARVNSKGNDRLKKQKTGQDDPLATASAARRKGKGKAVDKSSSRLVSATSDGGGEEEEDESLPPPHENVPRIRDIMQGKGGDAIREMVRANGWREATVDLPAADSVRDKRKDKNLTSESDTTTMGRDRSTSTAPTSSGEEDLPSSDQRKAKSRSKRTATTSTTKSRRRKTVPSPTPPPAFPEHVRAPSPEPFWGVAPVEKRGSSSKPKHRHGQATEHFKAMSKLQSVFNPVSDGEEIQDEDGAGDGEDHDDGRFATARAGNNYESVAAKAKREKAEGLAKLKETRQRKAAASASGTTNAAGTQQKRVDELFVATASVKENCPLCGIEIPKVNLQAHTNECLDAGVGFSQDDGIEINEMPPPRPPLNALQAPTPIQAPDNSQQARDRLAAELFSPSPPQRAKPLTSNDKGKGKAIPKPNQEEVEEIYDDEDEYYDEGDEDEEEYWSERTETRALQPTVIEIEDDDDAIEARGRGGVNSKHQPGPPRDGSSPPKGSIYVSTMSFALKEGYKHMYSASAEGAGGGKINPLAPQKMTTAAPVKRSGGTFKRGRGGWRKRGASSGRRARK